MGGWVGGWGMRGEVRMRCCGGWVGGWVEEDEAVGMRCYGECVGGWVGELVGHTHFVK